MNKNNFEIYKLENGVEVILVPRPDSPATTVMTTVMVGSKYEDKSLSGLSHFLEHMAFKGTKKRPSPSDIATELDGLGASYNASTNQEKTDYYAKVRNAHFDQALDIISDMYLNPTVPEEELEKERGVILEEINMYEDLPMRKIYDVFLQTLYGDQPAGWPILGRKEVIESLSRDDFMNYRNKHYKSENTIITIAGGYDQNNIKEKVRDAFSKLEREPETKMPNVQDEQNSPQCTVEFKESDQAHLLLGFKAFPSNDKRRPALEVLSNILGGGLSSRLFREIREKRGLAYYVSAGTSLFTNNGFVAARAGVTKNKIEESIKIILKEFEKIKSEEVQEGELEKAKENIIGNLFLSLETSDSLADFYTEQRVERLEIETPEKIAERVKSVTSEDVKQVAKDLFVGEKLNLSVIGPFKNKDFSDILKID